MYIVYSHKHILHATEGLLVEGQPFLIEETPARAEIIHQKIEQSQLGPIEVPKNHGLEPILAVHDTDYVDYLQRAFAEYVIHYPSEQAVVPGTFAPHSARHKTLHIHGQAGMYAFGTGAPILKGTWEAAYWSTQCALTAADQVLAGERAAYALCRPPGHHAAANLCGGFCYLNNVAIAARYLQTKAISHNKNGKTTSKIAILDVDYHHGNGTQEIFYDDPNVLFCSLHAHPDNDYPFFWGTSNETGSGSGIGFNRNWPLPQGIDDENYLLVLEQAIETICAFEPSYLLISLGLDTFIGDPVPTGGFNLTTDGIAMNGKCIANLNLPTIIVQEGGYLLEKLGENAVAFLEAFCK